MLQGLYSTADPVWWCLWVVFFFFLLSVSFLRGCRGHVHKPHKPHLALTKLALWYRTLQKQKQTYEPTLLRYRIHPPSRLPPPPRSSDVLSEGASHSSRQSERWINSFFIPTFDLYLEQGLFQCQHTRNLTKVSLSSMTAASDLLF